MRKYKGYGIELQPSGWAILLPGKTRVTSCDSRELAKRAIDDRIRSGRLPDLSAAKTKDGELSGQMSMDELLGGGK